MRYYATVVILALLLGGCDLLGGSEGTHEVLYQVNAHEPSEDFSVQVTYHMHGRQYSERMYGPKWRKRFMANPGDTLYLFVKDRTGEGPLSIGIHVNGDFPPTFRDELPPTDVIVLAQATVPYSN